jgi:hypothetical protein
MVRRYYFNGELLELHSMGPDYRYWRKPTPLWFWSENE